jgi:hypothetical protein
MNRIIFVLCIFLFSFTGDDAFKYLQKLSGSWLMKTEKGELYEFWDIKEKNNLMLGKSFMVTKDTMMLEQVELKKEGNEIFYIPTVEENNMRPVKFMLIRSSINSFTFENKEHDFPQRIIYRFVNNDSIVARIEGTLGGKFRFTEYYYKRQDIK